MYWYIVEMGHPTFKVIVHLASILEVAVLLFRKTFLLKMVWSHDETLHVGHTTLAERRLQHISLIVCSFFFGHFIHQILEHKVHVDFVIGVVFGAGLVLRLHHCISLFLYFHFDYILKYILELIIRIEC